ncbi:MAG: lysylphosphatidylglycerol synthase transmembrane domain-containing protein [Planctomycetota bacterium]
MAVVKAAVGLGLIGYLLWDAARQDSIDTLIEQPKQWTLLLVALGLTIASVLLSFVRWRMIVQAAGIEMGLAEASRAGALGFGLNAVGPGAVSGDLFKAVVVARGRVGQRTAAVTTVLVDRVMGLLTMLSVAGLAYALTSAFELPMDSAVQYTGRLVSLLAIGGLAGVGALFIPGLAGARLAAWLRRVPLAGEPLAEVVEVWAAYRSRPAKLASAAAVSVVVALLFVAGFYCVALGLPLDHPPLIAHGLIVPVALTAGALVPTPNGLGVREGAANLLYDGLGVGDGQGALIGLGHSLTLLTVSALAIVYYLAQRSRVQSEVANTKPAP